jgi:hypothetical protein
MTRADIGTVVLIAALSLATAFDSLEGSRAVERRNECAAKEMQWDMQHDACVRPPTL